MFDKTKEEFSKLCKEILQDNHTGKYSHAKVIAMVGFFAATIFMWKLIILGTLSTEIFTIYLVYTTGTQTLNKLLDAKLGIKAVNTNPANTAPKE